MGIAQVSPGANGVALVQGIAGKIGVLLGFLPDEHEKIQSAAKIEKRSMAQFIIFHSVDAAKKTNGEKS